MVQTNSTLEAVLRTSEWKELSRAIEAMRYEDFVERNAVGIKTVRYCWTFHRTMRTNPAWKKDARFAGENIQSIQKLVDYDYPDWSKDEPCPIWGHEGGDELQTSAFRHTVILATGAHWIFPMLKGYNNSGVYWFFIKKQTNGTGSHAFDVRTLPNFFKTLGIPLMVYEAFEEVDYEGGENSVIGNAENMISRLKLIEAYIKKMGFADIETLLNVAQERQPEWAEKRAEKHKLLAIRKTFTSIPVNGAYVLSKTTVFSEFADTAATFRYIGVGKNKSEQTELLVKLATDIYAQKTEIKYPKLEYLRLAYAQAKPHFATIIQAIDTLNGWNGKDVQLHAVIKMKTIAMVLVMLENAHWANTGLTKDYIQHRKESWKTANNSYYELTGTKGGMLEQTEKKIVAELLSCEDFIQAVFFTNPFDIEGGTDSSIDKHILKKLKDWETMYPNEYEYDYKIEGQVQSRIYYSLIKTLAETPIKDLPAKRPASDFMNIWLYFARAIAANFAFLDEENFTNTIQSVRGDLAFNLLTWKRNPTNKLAFALPEKVEVWHYKEKKNEMLGVLEFVWDKNVFVNADADTPLSKRFSKMQIAPQKIKVEYWASMTFPFVREDLLHFARSLPLYNNKLPNVEIIPCYQQF